jgi:hypothetical protein
MTAQHEGQTPRNVCKHGQLARSCEICELELENAGLWANNKRLDSLWADTTVEFLALQSENAELRQRLAAFEAITSSSQHMAVDRAILKGNSNGQG